MAEETIINASVDLTSAIKNINDLVRVIDKSLSKIDKLTKEVEKDITDGVAPVKQIKAKYSEIEKEAKRTATNIEKALKVKASIDTKSMTTDSANISKATKSMNVELEQSVADTSNLTKAFDNLSRAVTASNATVGAVSGGLSKSAVATIATTQAMSDRKSVV